MIPGHIAGFAAVLHPEPAVFKAGHVHIFAPGDGGQHRAGGGGPAAQIQPVGDDPGHAAQVTGRGPGRHIVRRHIAGFSVIIHLVPAVLAAQDGHGGAPVQLRQNGAAGVGGGPQADAVRRDAHGQNGRGGGELGRLSGSGAFGFLPGRGLRRRSFSGNLRSRFLLGGGVDGLGRGRVVRLRFRAVYHRAQVSGRQGVDVIGHGVHPGLPAGQRGDDAQGQGQGRRQHSGSRLAAELHEQDSLSGVDKSAYLPARARSSQMQPTSMAA